MSRVRRKRHRMTPEQRAQAAAEEAARMTEEQLERARAERALRLSEIIRRHARPCPDSTKPMRCSPTMAEVLGDVPRRSSPGNDWKIIYDTREAAEACAAELLVASGLKQRPHKCTRGRHQGHWHLTIDGPAARARHRSDPLASPTRPRDRLQAKTEERAARIAERRRTLADAVAQLAAHAE